MCTRSARGCASGTMLIGLGHTLGLRTPCCLDRAAMAIPGIWGTLFGREDQLRGSFAIATSWKLVGSLQLDRTAGWFQPRFFIICNYMQHYFRLANNYDVEDGKTRTTTTRALLFSRGGGEMGTGPRRLLCCQPREAALYFINLFLPL